FAQALLSDETSTSYIWVLELLLEANNGIIPTTIISDADTGLDAALKTFLPFVKHVHCIFHIQQNMDRHLQHTWYFTAGMTSTQCVEGINGIIKKYVNSKSSLVEFFRASEQIFPHIIEKLKKYLITEIYLIQKAQLDIGLEYNVALILLEQYESFNEDFIYENDPNSDDYADFAQISLESIIKQEFIDITGQHSYITQLSTILSIFREDLEEMTNDVNKKIEKRHLYNTFNQVLDELYDNTNEETSESASKKILNPHVIKCYGRPSFKRQKNSVEIHKDFKQDGNHSNKESRVCSNCEQTNYNVRRCSVPCKLCKQNGHMYLRCKGKNMN
ncbi:10018_t:CDS:2, partial [Gigaspora margarita]